MINSLRETMTLPVRNLPVSQRDHSSIGNIELLNQMGTIDARAKIALRCICLCKYPAITSYQHLSLQMQQRKKKLELEEQTSHGVDLQLSQNDNWITLLLRTTTFNLRSRVTFEKSAQCYFETFFSFALPTCFANLNASFFQRVEQTQMGVGNKSLNCLFVLFYTFTNVFFMKKTPLERSWKC